MDCKGGCELAQKYNHARRMGKHCLFGALMLLEGQTEAGLFPMGKGTFFVNRAFVLNTQKGPIFGIHTV